MAFTIQVLIRMPMLLHRITASILQSASPEAALRMAYTARLPQAELAFITVFILQPPVRQNYSFYGLGRGYFSDKVGFGVTSPTGQVHIKDNEWI
jgi:hypothetical protein